MFYLLGLHVGKSGRSPRVKQVQKFANYATTELGTAEAKTETNASSSSNTKKKSMKLLATDDRLTGQV